MAHRISLCCQVIFLRHNGIGVVQRVLSLILAAIQSQGGYLAHSFRSFQLQPYRLGGVCGIDYLYNEGNYTIDKNEAKKIWDEYQRILLEECPVIYLLRSRSFFAIRNRWNLTNVYFDNKSGAKTEYVWLSDQ